MSAKIGIQSLFSCTLLGFTMDGTMSDSPDDEFLELLKKSPFEEPSPFGEIMLHLNAAPASLQSRQTAIVALQAVVHAERVSISISSDRAICTFVLPGHVRVPTEKEIEPSDPLCRRRGTDIPIVHEP
jgi:hypothetical protein